MWPCAGDGEDRRSGGRGARLYGGAAVGMNDRPVIAVFGSSSPQPGSAAYETAREVGRLLAQRGYAVATGAYGGTMAAV
ncbi:MAG: hypothetical protein KDE28_11845, partial [Anaerolineales bacterium]|nr:hypothetical protein [Anaerolineales bacterium]